MARCIWISGFDCLDHDLKEFLTTIFELVIQSVDVSHSDNWDNYADQSERAEPDPSIEPDVQPANKTAIALAAKS